MTKFYGKQFIISAIADSNVVPDLCKKHRVRQLYVFGSVLTERFSEESDVDFAVSFSDMPRAEYADNYFSLKHSLEEAVGRPVDLVEYQSVQNPYFRRNLDATKQLIYKASSSTTFPCCTTK